MANEESGPLGKIFRSLVSAGRSETYSFDANQAQKDAQDLYDELICILLYDYSDFLVYFRLEVVRSVWLS